MISQRTEAEKSQIEHTIENNKSFYKVFRLDWTDKVLQELKYKLYGKVPRNFLVNVGGLIGSKTGIFKSAMGLQLAMEIDPLFNLKDRVAFSVNDLLKKVEENSERSLCETHMRQFETEYLGTYETQDAQGETCRECDQKAHKRMLLTKLLFFLDEQTQSLKMGGLLRLQNIVDTVRQRQICFITCGVEKYGFSYTTYALQRVQESHDKYLPKKRVRYAVYDSERDIYYGYFSWDITELSDPEWGGVWKEYSKMKQEFQRVAIAQQISGMDYNQMAVLVMEDQRFEQCVRTVKGKLAVISKLANNIIMKHFPDVTNQDRDMILAEIKFALNEGDEYDTKDGV